MVAHAPGESVGRSQDVPLIFFRNRNSGERAQVFILFIRDFLQRYRVSRIRVSRQI